MNSKEVDSKEVARRALDASAEAIEAIMYLLPQLTAEMKYRGEDPISDRNDLMDYGCAVEKAGKAINILTRASGYFYNVREGNV